MCCRSSSLHLSWNFRMGCSECFPGSLCLPGQIPNGDPCALGPESIQPCLRERVPSAFAINARKPKHHELEHRALPGRRRSPKQPWLGSDNLPSQTAHSRRPWALGGQAWVSQERQVALGLTTHMGVHYHPLIRAQGPGL